MPHAQATTVALVRDYLHHAMEATTGSVHMACSRASSDPVIRAYLDQYRINLLKTPRESLALGSVVVERGDGQTLVVGSLRDLFGAEPDLKTTLDEALAHQTTEFTTEMEAAGGLGILEALTSGFGLLGKGKASAAYGGAKTFRMRVKDGQRDSVDLGSLARYLAGAALDPDQRLFREGDRLYVVAALVKATTLDVTAKDQRGGDLSVEAEATGLGSGNGRLRASRQGKLALSYASDVPLVYGVELLELDPADGWHLEGVKAPVQVRGKVEGTHHRTDKSERFIGGNRNEGELFVEL